MTIVIFLIFPNGKLVPAKKRIQNHHSKNRRNQLIRSYRKNTRELKNIFYTNTHVNRFGPLLVNKLSAILLDIELHFYVTGCFFYETRIATKQNA